MHGNLGMKILITISSKPYSHMHYHWCSFLWHHPCKLSQYWTQTLLQMELLHLFTHLENIGNKQHSKYLSRQDKRTWLPIFCLTSLLSSANEEYIIKVEVLITFWFEINVLNSANKEREMAVPPNRARRCFTTPMDAFLTSQDWCDKQWTMAL